MRIETITHPPFEIPRVDSPNVIYEPLETIRERFRESPDFLLLAVGEVDWCTTTIQTAALLANDPSPEVIYEKEKQFKHLMTLVAFPERRPWLDIPNR